VLLISVYSPDLGFPERAGPLEYLQPPFGLPELTARLERLIGSRSPARQDDSGPVRCARAAGRPGIGGSEAD
jgi:hypothetical protein